MRLGGKRGWRRFIVSSLLAHALLAIAAFFIIGRRPPERTRLPITLVEFNPASTRATPPQTKPPETSRRVVETARGELAEQAAPDAYLGERTQTVDRVKIHRRRLTQIGADQAKPAPRPLAKEASKPPEPSKREAASGTDPLPKSPDPVRGDLRKLGLAILPPRRAPTAGGAPSVPAEERHWAEQGSSPEDYVPGVAEGDRTALNTKEYVFYGYFKRIRSRLDRAWVPILRERLTAMWRAGRHLASDMDHRTQVLVILNVAGEIVRVELQGESGVRALDESAVRAFNEAGPFPNPPHGIVDANREIRIPWEFILKS